MNKKRPLGVTLIGYFYIFGAIVLITTLFTNAPQQFGIAGELREVKNGFPLKL